VRWTLPETKRTGLLNFLRPYRISRPARADYQLATLISTSPSTRPQPWGRSNRPMPELKIRIVQRYSVSLEASQHNGA
jgi:hypothetical protein